MKPLDKQFARPQIYGMWFLTNNIDSQSIEWELTMFINNNVLRLRSKEWKSSSITVQNYKMINDHDKIVF